MGAGFRTIATANRNTVLCSYAAISRRRLALRGFENCATAGCDLGVFFQASNVILLRATRQDIQINMLCCPLEASAMF